MSIEPIKVLMIEDNRGDYQLILKLLEKSENAQFELVHSPRLKSGVELLENNSFDVILLDLGLPDSNGLDSFNVILKKHPEIPTIILTGLANEETGIQAIKYGAQDYLVKGEFNGKLLVRAIQYAIERKKLEGLFVY
ncbi:response regulator receiver protein [Methanobacterium lacus]|jgi:DNA-binding response OmpR family regulator|uniref:Response regulator receiver protein n=1 Tax=Methanobacterium lacus (strain AL-21) TaxID=877455 RepID=F0TCL4_METLA|nr:response regulator [Methanobacterium lacus]ADZ09291.1 response regulator receiver protein [Methanobacterium lacus]